MKFSLGVLKRRQKALLCLKRVVSYHRQPPIEKRQKTDKASTPGKTSFKTPDTEPGL